MKKTIEQLIMQKLSDAHYTTRSAIKAAIPMSDKCINIKLALLLESGEIDDVTVKSTNNHGRAETAYIRVVK